MTDLTEEREKKLWDFRGKLFKYAYDQGLIDFPIEMRGTISISGEFLTDRVDWKNPSHGLMVDKINRFLNDFYKLFIKKKLTIAQMVDIISNKEPDDLKKILDSMSKPKTKKVKFPPPTPEKEGYTYVLVVTERDKSEKPVSGYWRGKRIKKIERCSHEICEKELEFPYTPIEVSITVLRGSKKIKPEKYKGKFCSWRCSSDQQDIWFQRSNHV